MKPQINLSHLKSLTDDVGIIQHTKFDIPDRKNGYALDDQARALIATILLGEDKLAKIYLSFLYHSQTEDGLFYTFMDYERKFNNINSLRLNVGISDAFALSFWALTVVKKEKKGTGLDELADTMLQKTLDHLLQNDSLRILAYTILGLTELKDKERLEKACGIMVDKYWNNNATVNWRWFENKLTYANGIIPYSLIRANSILNSPEIEEIIIASSDFLEKESRIANYPAPIGSFGWYKKGGNRALFDQQCIDAAFMVMMHNALHKMTKDKKYKKLAKDWFKWFTGNNVHEMKLYEEKTGKVYDGLTYKSVNKNAGAESVIVYVLAALSMHGKL